MFCKLLGHNLTTKVKVVPIECLWKYEYTTTVTCSRCKEVISKTIEIKDFLKYD